MFKDILKRNASPSKGSPKQAADKKQLDANQLLSLAQTSLSRLRIMQPSDPEAFPLVNEASRCGENRTPVLKSPSIPTTMPKPTAVLFTVQQLEIEVSKLSGTDEHPLWRL